MAGKHQGSKGRSHELDAKILRTSNRQLQARAQGDEDTAESAERVMRHLAIKGGGTTDFDPESDDA